MIVFKKNYWLCFASLAVLVLFSACPDDDDMTVLPPPEITSYDSEGFFIVNQGTIGTGIGSLSFYHREYGIAENAIFQMANPGEVLGNTAQSMTIIDGKAYVVVKNSNKIVIVNPSDMKLIGEIYGFEQPKQIIQAGPDKAYVSQWGSTGEEGNIKVVDLNTNSIINTIATRPGPEEMIRIGNNVFVANTGGIFVDSIVTKISVQNDEILKTIDVGLTPTYLEIDKDLNLWVLTRGQILDPGDPSINIKGRLIKIENDEVTLSLKVKPAASNLTINPTKDKLYFIQNGWVYEHPIVNTAISLVPFIERDFFGFEVDPLTGNFIGMDAKNFIEKGELFIFDSDRMPLDTVEVGISPGQAVFN